MIKWKVSRSPGTRLIWQARACWMSMRASGFLPVCVVAAAVVLLLAAVRVCVVAAAVVLLLAAVRVCVVAAAVFLLLAAVSSRE